MARQTLTVQLMHAQAEITRLSEELAQAHADLAEVREDAKQMRIALDSSFTLPAPTPYVPARRELPLHFQRARELAMRTGRSVKASA
jgi:hypothetical protein